MQSLLTTAIEMTATFGILYIVTGLILNYPRWRANGNTFHPTSAPVLETATDDDAQSICERFPLKIAAALIATPVATLSINIDSIPQVDYVTSIESLGVPALRKRCGELGIQWRNAHGINKHLRKREMITALQG